MRKKNYYEKEKFEKEKFENAGSRQQLYDYPLLTLPNTINWDNFIRAAERGRVFEYMKNSLKVFLTPFLTNIPKAIDPTRSGTG